MAKSVYIGLSGGVDSSVAAALLKQQGYQVTGVFMKNWTADVLGFICPWRQDLADAASVAAKLEIPLKIYDFQRQYKQKVVDYMITQFKLGFTPNPDVMCNQEIKFKLFLNAALEDGADMIATGHYSRLKSGKLYAAKDKNKDQSYFLYRLGEKAITKTLMPLGRLTKPQVRQLASQFGLVTANKPDSVGICFIGEVPLRDFLAQYIKPKNGPIKNLDGQIIGEHDGVAFYTIGQRHGLEIGGGRPYYVVGKEIKSNTLIVTNNPADDELHRREFYIEEASWINKPPYSGKTYQIRSRYRGRLIAGQLSRIILDSKYKVSLTEPERALTPGQSAVVYDGERVLGGGIIALA